MTLYKVADLEGALLDLAVAFAEGWRMIDDPIGGSVLASPAGTGGWAAEIAAPPFSTDWRNGGGPIIERERISVTWPEINPSPGYEWHANIARPEASWNAYGPTPLIAAMRAYVASRLGEEVTL